MTTTKSVETPELDKLKKVAETSQQIGAFLDWLQNEKHCVIAEWTPENELMPISRGSYGMIETLLAEYFNIDLAKVEEERRAILEDLKFSRLLSKKDGRVNSVIEAL